MSSTTAFPEESPSRSILSADARGAAEAFAARVSHACELFRSCGGADLILNYGVGREVGPEIVVRTRSGPLSVSAASQARAVLSLARAGASRAQVIPLHGGVDFGRIDLQ